MEATDYYIALDASTTSTTILLYTAAGKLIQRLSKEHKQIAPQPGWLEHDFDEVYKNLQEQAVKLLEEASKTTGAKIEKSQVKGLGITNQRETVLAWSKTTGELLYNAVVWSDTRTTEVAEAFKNEHGGQSAFKDKTGLPVSTYFTAFKIRWLLQNSEKVKESFEKKDVFFGNVNTYLIWKLTKGEVFATDPSNASRMYLMDIRTLKYDPKLLEIFGLTEDCLPEIRPNFGDFGTVSDETTGLEGIPILCSIGDQQSSALALGGTAKITYGTGCFMIKNTGETPITDVPGIITTVIYTTSDGKTTYGLEAAVECGGSTINWLRNTLKLFTDYGEMEKSVSALENNGGVFFVPCFAGIYSPFWVDEAKSTLVGLTMNSKPENIIRACLEGICYRIKDCFVLMNKYGGEGDIYVDGGLTQNKFFLELQQAILKDDGANIVKSGNPDPTPFGSFFGCLVAKGVLGPTETGKMPFEAQEVKELEGFVTQHDEWKKIIEFSCSYGKN